MNPTPTLPALLESYFTQCLMAQRQASPHTDFDGPVWPHLDGHIWPHPVTTVCPIPAGFGFCRPGGSGAWRRPQGGAA